MGPKSLAALGIAAYLLFLAAGIPASFLAERARSATSGMVQLTDPEGTLWNGKARATILPPRALAIPVDAIQWRFRPARLLAGELAFAAQLSAGSLAADLEAARGLSGWAMRDLRASGDASSLSAFVPLLATWRPAGPVRLSAPRLAWDGRELRGEAALEWRAATTSLSDLKPLGAYKLDLVATGGPAKLTLATLEGPLAIRGEGRFDASTGVTFSGEARADAAQARALEPLLALMGPRRPDGAHALEWRLR